MKYTNRIVITDDTTGTKFLDVTTQDMEIQAERKAFTSRFTNVGVMIERIPASEEEHEMPRAIPFPNHAVASAIVAVASALGDILSWLVRVGDKHPNT